MLKLLIKKQYRECFRSYFVNPKTGKKRTKSGMIGMFVLFAAIMLFLAFSFYMMFVPLAPILQTDIKWLFFVESSILALCLGTFGSVFNTYNCLYMSKDNEFLLSMPIKPLDILLSRLSLVYGLSLLYCGVAWLPCVLCAIINGVMNPLSVLLSILTLLLIALFVSAISCVLGLVIAIVSTKVKNRSFITVIISLVFFALYFFGVNKLDGVIENMLLESEKIANGIKTWANLIYHLGNGATGNFVSFIIFAAVALAFGGIILYLLLRSYNRVLTTHISESTISSKVTYTSSKNVKYTLFKKELKHFTSIPTYMLNTGLGIIIVLAMAVMSVIKRSDLLLFVSMIQEEIPEIASFIPLILASAIILPISMDMISTPSISLEGKNLWILKTLPINPHTVLAAKEMLHVVINAVPALISVIVIGICANIELNQILYVVCIVFLSIEIEAILGIMLDLLRPNFSWTNVTQPIKQSLNVLIMMMFGMLMTVAMSLIYYLVRNIMGIDEYLYYLVIIMLVITILLKRLMRSKGVKLFKEL